MCVSGAISAHLRPNARGDWTLAVASGKMRLISKWKGCSSPLEVLERHATVQSPSQKAWTCRKTNGRESDSAFQSPGYNIHKTFADLL